jgi:hypothetical protein
MAFPYTVTIAGLVATLRQLRSAFPSQVTPDTLRRWGIAPNNETYVLHILRFLGIIDEEGKKVAENAKIFSEVDDEAFAKRLSALVQKAYEGLFEHYGDKTWTLERQKLIGFFRGADDTTARVGYQQAATFQALASLAGHGAAPAEAKATPTRARKSVPSPSSTRKERAPAPARGEAHTPTPPPKVPETTPPAGSPALTVRVEINLPVTDDQEVYDKIFRSIRTNLLLNE